MVRDWRLEKTHMLAYRMSAHAVALQFTFIGTSMYQDWCERTQMPCTQRWTQPHWTPLGHYGWANTYTKPCLKKGGGEEEQRFLQNETPKKHMGVTMIFSMS